MAQLGFDARQVAPQAALEIIPAGWYKAAMDESEMKPTRDATGSYLACRFNLLEGQYAGRKVFTNLNLRNANAKTVEIAFAQLSAIAHAVGVMDVQDSSQLHGRPLMIKLKVRKDDSGEYEDRNEISSYKAVDAAAGAQAAVQSAAPSFPPSMPPAVGGWSAAAAAPPPPVAPPPAPPADPMAAARADGWLVHPSAPGYHYKGQEVLADAQIAAKYAAPVAPAAPPAAPPAPWVPPAGGQPWQQQPPATASAAPAAPPTPPQPPHPAQDAVPPWQKPK